MRSKAGAMIARASGLRSCFSSVDSLMPADRAAAGLCLPGTAVPTVKVVAHCAHKGASGGFSKPHFGHALLKRPAHRTQTSAPSGFLVEQLWQRIDPPTKPGERLFLITYTKCLRRDYNLPVQESHRRRPHRPRAHTEAA